MIIDSWMGYAFNFLEIILRQDSPWLIPGLWSPEISLNEFMYSAF